MQLGRVGHYRTGRDEKVALVVGVLRDEGRPESVALVVFPNRDANDSGDVYDPFFVSGIPVAPQFGPSPSVSFHLSLDCPEGL